MDNVEDFTKRALRALEAFKGEEKLRYCDLPPLIGYKTMRLLVARGLLEVVDNTAGPLSKDRAWRLKR